MFENKTEEEARKQILDEVAAYCRTFHNRPAPFHEGDRIPYASRVYDEHEMTNLVDAALEFWLTTGRYTKEFLLITTDKRHRIIYLAFLEDSFDDALVKLIIYASLTYKLDKSSSVKFTSQETDSHGVFQNNLSIMSYKENSISHIFNYVTVRS